MALMAGTDDVLDAREAASYLRINEQTVRRLARDNEIPAFKVGGSWRFKRSSLDRWAVSQEMRPKTKGLRILVVDDDQGVRNLVSRSLGGEGHSVTAVSGGREVLSMVAEGAPDLVFLDLKVPDVDGPTLLGEIRQAWGAVPVIVLTGYPESDLMERALEHGPITLLAKPSSATQIVQTVQSIWRQD